MKRKGPQDSYFDNYYDVRGLDQMSIIVTIPASLRKKWHEAQEQVSCEGKTIGECLDDLDRRLPGFKETLLDETGNIRETITIFLCGQNIGNLDKLSTVVQDKDEISIIPFMAGG